jgi:DNA-directed RNA polymerase specialized sigma24 family protein
MSQASQISAYLPYLRRYARALTGTQASGDSLVAATLEAIIADTEILPSDAVPRLALYRVFQKVWAAAAKAAEPDAAPAAGAPVAGRPAADMASARLAAITPLSRQALLLGPT